MTMRCVSLALIMAPSCEYTWESISCSSVLFGYGTGGPPPPRIHATTFSYEGRARIPILCSISMAWSREKIFTPRHVNSEGLGGAGPLWDFGRIAQWDHIALVALQWDIQEDHPRFCEKALSC